MVDFHAPSRIFIQHQQMLWLALCCGTGGKLVWVPLRRFLCRILHLNFADMGNDEVRGGDLPILLATKTRTSIADEGSSEARGIIRTRSRLLLEEHARWSPLLPVVKHAELLPF
jgi:hypothetical protein